MTDTALKILVVLPTLGTGGGGVSEAARLVVEAWSKRSDLHVEVATFQDAKLEEAKASWPDVPIHAFENKIRRFGYAPDMRTFLIEHDYDIAHVHGLWMYHCYAAFCGLKRGKKPYAITPHGMLEPWILQRSKLLKKVVSTLFHTEFLKRSLFIHTLTDRESRDVLALVPQAKTVEVPNFVTAIDHGPHAPSWWRNDFDAKRTILFFGRIHDKKGWKELLEAWEQNCSASADFKDKMQLVFCGWVDEAQGFEERVSALNSQFGNVLFAGPQYGADREDSYGAVDAFILPSKSEGLPMSILEAWGAGLPVLMTDECNLTVGFQEDAAIRINTDAPRLAGQLLELSQMSNDSLKTIGSNGLALQQRKYSAQACASLLAETFKDRLKK